MYSDIHAASELYQSQVVSFMWPVSFSGKAVMPSEPTPVDTEKDLVLQVGLFIASCPF